MDKNRRKFLKIILIGGGTLIAGKVLNPLFSVFSDNSSAKTDSSTEADTRNFQISEDKKSLSIFDSAGEEIFQIDKEA